MNRNCCSAGIFDDLCNLHRIYRIAFKSNTDFCRHRLLYCMRDLRHNLLDQFGILKKCRAFPIVDHLRHRTSHIDIQNIKRLLLYALGNLCHQIRFTSKNLHGNRMLRRIDLHKRNCIFVMKRNCLGTDHLCTQKSCSLFFT